MLFRSAFFDPRTRAVIAVDAQLYGFDLRSHERLAHLEIGEQASLVFAGHAEQHDRAVAKQQRAAAVRRSEHERAFADAAPSFAVAGRDASAEEERANLQTRRSTEQRSRSDRRGA